MKKATILMLAMAAILLSSCVTDYYEPVFGLDNLPAIVPAEGGTYAIAYDYSYYGTKADTRYFDWQCRVIVDGEVVTVTEINRSKAKTFQVTIGPNRASYPKSILVEASTHVRTYDEDWWGDWTPICSAVQLNN